MNWAVPIIYGNRAVFIPHNGFTRQMTADDIFAECLAEGDSSEEAARRPGFPPGSGRYHAKRLIERLGG